MKMMMIVFQMRSSPFDQVLKGTRHVPLSLTTLVNCFNVPSAFLSTPINWRDAQRLVDAIKACPIYTSIYPVCFSFFFILFIIISFFFYLFNYNFFGGFLIYIFCLNLPEFFSPPKCEEQCKVESFDYTE